jgi:hypothetical protein
VLPFDFEQMFDDYYTRIDKLAIFLKPNFMIIFLHMYKDGCILGKNWQFLPFFKK